MKQAEEEVTAASQQGSAEDNAEKIEEQRKTLREELKAKKNKLTEVKVCHVQFAVFSPDVLQCS